MPQRARVRRTQSEDLPELELLLVSELEDFESELDEPESDFEADDESELDEPLSLEDEPLVEPFFA